MNDELIEAYRRAHYRVFDPAGAFVMQIDVPCPGLARCHEPHGVTRSAFITAWNPGSKVQTEAVNATAQTRLQQAIAEGEYPTLEGQGEDPDGKWTPERSCLVLGIDAAGARRLGREFGQRAIVFAGPDCVPRLLTLPLETGTAWSNIL